MAYFLWLTDDDDKRSTPIFSYWSLFLPAVAWVRCFYARCVHARRKPKYDRATDAGTDAKYMWKAAMKVWSVVFIVDIIRFLWYVFEPPEALGCQS